MVCKYHKGYLYYSDYQLVNNKCYASRKCDKVKSFASANTRFVA